MNLTISERIGEDKEKQIIQPILSYQTLVNKPDMHIAIQSNIASNDDKSKRDIAFYQIRKVQFIAVCKIELYEAVVAAFYIGEYSTRSTNYR